MRCGGGKPRFFLYLNSEMSQKFSSRTILSFIMGLSSNRFWKSVENPITRLTACGTSSTDLYSLGLSLTGEVLPVLSNLTSSAFMWAEDISRAKFTTYCHTIAYMVISRHTPHRPSLPPVCKGKSDTAIHSQVDNIEQRKTICCRKRKNTCAFGKRSFTSVWKITGKPSKVGADQYDHWLRPSLKRTWKHIQHAQHQRYGISHYNEYSSSLALSDKQIISAGPRILSSFSYSQTNLMTLEQTAYHFDELKSLKC